MSKLATILAQAERLRRDNQAFAVATVAKINGPAYRRPGARMIVTRDGTTMGAISSGCLEGEVIQHSLSTLSSKAPKVVSFDVNEADPILGFGSGCGGSVDVLVEYVNPTVPDDPLKLIESCWTTRKPGVLATVIHYRGNHPDILGQHWLQRTDGIGSGNMTIPEIRKCIEKEARDVISSHVTRIRQYDIEGVDFEVLYEVIEPPIRLILFGTGQDVKSAVRIAGVLGWQTCVVGNRSEVDLAERIPEATSHIFLMHADRVREYVPLDERSAVIIMNHSYVRDRTLLSLLLDVPVGYLGVLGPISRTERMCSDLRSSGDLSPGGQVASIHAPVGLDIGAETPEEIGLSIVSEVQAVFAGRAGGKLTETSKPIHDKVPIY